MKLLSALLLFVGIANAMPYNNMAMWKQPVAAASNKLAFTNSAYSGVSTWSCSGPMVIESQTSGGAPLAVGSNLAVSLTSPTNTYFYSDSNCATRISSATILSGQSSVSGIYFSAGVTANPMIVSAAAASYNAGTQSEAITTLASGTWIGAAADGNWATNGNWSSGAPPSATPAIFDTNCGANCNLTTGPASNTSITKLRMSPGYTGTVTLSTGNLSVSVSAATVLEGGTLQQGSGKITHNGGGTINGATVKTGSGTYQFQGTMKLMSGSFDATSGTNTITVGPTGAGVILSGGTFAMNAASSTNTLVVTTAFTQTGGTFNGGSGNVSISTLPNPTTISGGNFRAPSANLTIGGDFTLAAPATFNANGGAVIFSSTAPLSTSITPGAAVFNLVTLSPISAVMNLSGTMTVNGNLKVGNSSGQHYEMRGGTINVYGASISTISNYGYWGSTNIVAAGRAAGQTITTLGGLTGFPTLTIAAGANPVTLSNTNFIGIASGFTFTSAAPFNVAGSQLILGFQNDGPTAAITPGAVTYADVGITSSVDLGGGTMKVGGKMYFASGGANVTFDNGTFEVNGDIEATTYTEFTGSGVTKLLGGAGGSTLITSYMDDLNYGEIPNLWIAAGSNTVTFPSVLVVGNGYKYTSGNLANIAGSTLYLVGNYFAGTTISSAGTETYDAVTLHGQHTTYNFSGTTMKVGGNLTLMDASQNDTIDNGTLSVAGNVTQSDDNPWYGSGIVKVIGRASGSTISTAASAFCLVTGNDCGLPNLEITAGTNNVTFGTLVKVVKGYAFNSAASLTTTGSKLILMNGNSATPDNFKFGWPTYNHVTVALGCDNNPVFQNGVIVDIGGDFKAGQIYACNTSLTGPTFKVAGNVDLSPTDMNASGITGNYNVTMTGISKTMRGMSTYNFTTGLLTIDPGAGNSQSLASAFAPSGGATVRMSIASGTFNLANFNADLAASFYMAAGTVLNRGTGVLKINGVTRGAGAYTANASNGTIN